MVKNWVKDFLMFTLISSCFTTFKVAITLKNFFKSKPKIYKCNSCHEQILRGTGIFVEKQTICLNCFLEGRM